MKKIVFIVIALANTFFSFSQTQNLDLGAKHNQLVNYLDGYDFTGKDADMFVDDAFFAVGNMFGAFPNGRPEGRFGIAQFCGKADPKDLDPFKTTNFDGAIDKLKLNGSISQTSSDFLKSIVTGTENSIDLNDCLAKIAVIESNFNTSSLGGLEKVIVQGTADIFKSSLTHWNTYGQQQNQSLLFNKKGWNWRCILCVAVRDIIGAGLGYLIGTCLCAKLGVTDPVICGAIGAVLIGGIYSWAAKVCPGVCTRCSKPNPNSYPSWICQLPFLYW